MRITRVAFHAAAAAPSEDENEDSRVGQFRHIRLPQHSEARPLVAAGAPPNLWVVPGVNQAPQSPQPLVGLTASPCNGFAPVDEAALPFGSS